MMEIYIKNSNYIVINMSKVSLLVLTTSKNRTWKNIEESYLWNMTLQTFIKTKSPGYQYTIYVGYDHDDVLFSDSDNKNKLELLCSQSDVAIRFVSLTIEKGYVTKMWNVLFDLAYVDGMDYFYQCGDDIVFHTNNWVRDGVLALQRSNGVGMSGPFNNNSRIMTQAMFSRVHKEVFGWLFPEEIRNWCCDDWYNELYKDKYMFPSVGHYCSNDGGAPRYVINGDANFNQTKLNMLRNQTSQLAQQHRQTLQSYLKNLDK